MAEISMKKAVEQGMWNLGLLLFEHQKWGRIPAVVGQSIVEENRMAVQVD